MDLHNWLLRRQLSSLTAFFVGFVFVACIVVFLKHNCSGGWPGVQPIMDCSTVVSIMNVMMVQSEFFPSLLGSTVYMHSTCS